MREIDEAVEGLLGAIAVHRGQRTAVTEPHRLQENVRVPRIAELADERGEINRRRLGWWIRRHAGRIVDGRRFIRASGNRSAEAWQVESVSPVSSVSSAPGRESISGATDSSNAYARASRGA